MDEWMDRQSDMHTPPLPFRVPEKVLKAAKWHESSHLKCACENSFNTNFHTAFNICQLLRTSLEYSIFAWNYAITLIRESPNCCIGQVFHTAMKLRLWVETNLHCNWSLLEKLTNEGDQYTACCYEPKGWWYQQKVKLSLDHTMTNQVQFCIFTIYLSNMRRSLTWLKVSLTKCCSHFLHPPCMLHALLISSLTSQWRNNYIWYMKHSLG
jgi:hypothetical protein